MADEVKVSEKFCAPDADVAFKSSDGVLFHIHKINLKTSADGFAPPEFSTFDEIVQLTEISSTLERLFQFIYPVRQPDLEFMDFSILEPLAEAAEKYQVYAAMSICKVFMKNTLPQHAEVVMAYAVKHGYPDIMDMSAPLLLDQPFDECLTKLPINLFIPWARYYGCWSKVAQATLAQHTRITSYSSSHNGVSQRVCSSCRRSPVDRQVVSIITRLGEGVQSLQHLGEIFDPSLGCCDYNKACMRSWRESLEKEIQSIPKLSTFL